MLVIGLTGSIAMGKSHAARIFRAYGMPVFDADAEVHALLARGGAAVAALASIFPGVADEAGGIDRAVLGHLVFGDQKKLRRLEAVLHPLVREAERRFLAHAARQGRPMVVLDIPLLFETGAERRCDQVVVVSAAGFLQWDRAMARPGMTAARLAHIIRGQTPDRIKRRRADFVLNSGLDRGQMVRQIGAVLGALRHRSGRAWPDAWRTGGIRP